MLLYFFHLKKGEFSLEARQPDVEICCIWIWYLRISLHIRRGVGNTGFRTDLSSVVLVPAVLFPSC